MNSNCKDNVRYRRCRAQTYYKHTWIASAASVVLSNICRQLCTKSNSNALSSHIGESRGTLKKNLNLPATKMILKVNEVC